MKVILDVPKVKQLKYYCAPASLEMLVRYYGMNISQQEIAKELVAHEKVGFKTSSIYDFLENHGFTARGYENDSIDSLMRYINKERPTLVRVGIGNHRFAHFMIIKGYNSDEKLIYFNDSSDLRRSKLSFREFNRIWTVHDLGYSRNLAIYVIPKKTITC